MVTTNADPQQRMDKEQAEAMAEQIKADLGDRASDVRVFETVHWRLNYSHWSVKLTVDNKLYLSFAEPHQWDDLKQRYGLP